MSHETHRTQDSVQTHIADILSEYYQVIISHQLHHAGLNIVSRPQDDLCYWYLDLMSSQN